LREVDHSAFMRRLTASARLPRSLILRYHEGLSMEDVATGLKVKLSAAKMRVHRGLAKLRDILEKKQDGKKNSKIQPVPERPGYSLGGGAREAHGASSCGPDEVWTGSRP